MESAPQQQYDQVNNKLSHYNYLQERNLKFYRGHSNFIHPLYELEFQNAVSCITNLLNYSILKYAHYKRLQAIYNLAAEKCFNKNNDYSFSEAEVCEEQMIDKDVVLSNIQDFNKEVEARLQDAYEKNVKFAQGEDESKFSVERYESDHRIFLLKVHFLYRYYYYFLARRLFLDSWQ